MSTHPVRICSFESRRQRDMESLITKLGGIPTIAPSMQEVPVDSNAHLEQFASLLLAGEFDCVLFLTGVGTSALFDTLAPQFPLDVLRPALAHTWVVARGPKPAAVLREKQVRIDALIPEPNTWKEILEALQAHWENLAGVRIAIQEYGGPATDLVDALQAADSVVTPVPVYRWQLPDDIGPLQAAVRGTIDGQFDVLMWTSAQQVTHVVEIAEQMGVRTAWLEAAGKLMIASIGPIASERLREYGLEPTLEPSHPKMGHLAKETIEQFPRVPR